MKYARNKRRSIRIAMALAGLGVGMGTAVGAHAQSVRPGSSVQRPFSDDSDRFRSSIDAFTAADQLTPPPSGGVLFVGSSSIRLWDGLEGQFGGRDAGVIQRGFGGSRMADLVAYEDQLVLPYKPRMVVVYAGDNDLAEGRTPSDVLKSFTAFVDAVREDMPDTRIAYISIKPSPCRAALQQQAREANALIAAYAAKGANLDFIDIYSPMLGDDGRPRADLFGPDALHMNASGYALWKQVISAHLPPAAKTLPAAARTVLR